MEWMFCELEINSSPLNSSLQQICTSDLVLISLIYKKARDSLLHPSVSQFMDSQKGIQSQLNCTLVKKNMRERVNEYTFAPKQLCSNLLTATIYPIELPFFMSLPKNDMVQTHCSAFSQKIKKVLHYFTNPTERLKELTPVLRQSLQIFDHYCILHSIITLSRNSLGLPIKHKYH